MYVGWRDKGGRRRREGESAQTKTICAEDKRRVPEKVLRKRKAAQDRRSRGECTDDLWDVFSGQEVFKKRGRPLKTEI